MTDIDKLNELIIKLHDTARTVKDPAITRRLQEMADRLTVIIHVYETIAHVRPEILS